MRTNTVFLVLLAAVLSAPSCIRIMESGEDGASIIFIECLQGVSDTTAISVISTAPRFGYDGSRILSDMNVTLKAGGKEIPLSNAGVEAELFPKGAYYTTEKIPGGQTLEIEVSGQGLEPVVATTVKPQEVRPFRMNLERTLLYDEEYSSTDIGTKVIKMEISPDDPEMSDHYYALVFDSIVNDDGYARYGHPIPLLRSNGFYSSDFGDAVVVSTAFSRWSFFGSRYSFFLADKVVNAYLWRGASVVKDGKITVYFNDYYGAGVGMRAHLFVVSPEFYRYARSIEYNFDSADELAPFFPSTYSYTNVQGGCGVFGAVSRYDGEWAEAQ